MFIYGASAVGLSGEARCITRAESWFKIRIINEKMGFKGKAHVSQILIYNISSHFLFVLSFNSYYFTKNFLMNFIFQLTIEEQCSWCCRKLQHPFRNTNNESLMRCREWWSRMFGAKSPMNPFFKLRIYPTLSHSVEGQSRSGARRTTPKRLSLPSINERRPILGVFILRIQIWNYQLNDFKCSSKKCPKIPVCERVCKIKTY